ncbi:MAG: tRNA uridine-5-carboxymethylaminomethyl(34) synthesis GTPase MnmE, partial [Rickettsiales bacterium]
MNATIFAPATPPGRSGVAVFRISGDKAKAALEALTGKPCPAPRQAALRHLYVPETKEVIDHALAIYFAAPNSFTGEDVVELHIHGSRAVLTQLSEVLASMEGLQLAEPGEFTRR